MSEQSNIAKQIELGKTVLGIELGSTRIKAVLIDERHTPVASGGYGWENRLEDGVWTYSLADVWTGIRACYRDLVSDVQARYGVAVTTFAAIGVSAMMHGYLPFAADGAQLAPFRTWRNTITAEASEKLTALFGFNIPQRWSISHLYRAMENGEAHVPQIDFLTTLSGYVHWKLTGARVLGVGDAAGMFPIDSACNDYDARMVKQFDALVMDKGLPWKLTDILPRVLPAGAPAGTLTAEGAALLDETGTLQPGIPLCPPEGDAGTGMTATNSVAARTGNVSAGTSIFAMAVLERPLSRVYPEIDMVTTPTGKPVAMVHCNNCTSDLDAWIRLFGEAAAALGANCGANDLYTAMYGAALAGAPDAGGLINYNYFSGEHITHVDTGRPLFVRSPENTFTLGNFMRAQIYSALATLKIGMDLLFDNEHIALDELLGHGGFFKTKGVGQALLAGALNVPVSVMETAGEGGAWGIALLAAYLVNADQNESLEAYLSGKVFANSPAKKLSPTPSDVAGFATFLSRYRKGLSVERAASETI